MENSEVDVFVNGHQVAKVEKRNLITDFPEGATLTVSDPPVFVFFPDTLEPLDGE